MAITEIQSVSAKLSGPYTPPSATFSGTPAAGNLLIALVGVNISGGDVTISLSGWTLAQEKTSAFKCKEAVFYKVAGASEPVTVTASLTAERTWVVCLVEAHTTAAVGWVHDKQASATGTSTSPASGTTDTTTTAEEYWVAGLSCATNQSLSSPTNSFAIKEQQAASVSTALLTRIVAGTGAASTGGTYASSAVYVGTIDTFMAQAQTVTVAGATLSGTGTLIARANYPTPTLVMLAAFGYTATDPLPAWTNISSYCRNFVWQRGKQNELNQMQAGSATVILNDPDSDFDPSNTGSPFYPNVKPGLPVRALLLVGSTRYELFYGFAQRLPRTQRVGSVYTQRNLELTDGFALLAFAGLGGFSYPEQSSDQRVRDVLDDIGWPAARRQIGTGTSTLQEITFPGEDTTTAQAHLQAVDESEDGLLFVDGGNNLVFVGSGELAAAPWTTSQATFTDNPVSTPAFGIDAYTVLCLHCDGTDASTTFTDSSTAAHTVTANGNAQVDTAQKQFGTGSALFDGTGDYLSADDSDDWNLAAGDFTIDCWVRFTSSIGAERGLAAQYTGAQKSWRFEYNPFVGGLYFVYSADGTNVTAIAKAWSPSLDTWYHVAAVRSGTNFQMFVDGTQIGTTATLNATLFDSTAALTIGITDPAAALSPMNGWIDELRISKGVARWTTTFTPPAQAYYAAVPATGYGYINLVPSYDLDNVYNRWTVTRDNGSPQTAEDTTSQAEYFLRARQTSTLLSTDAQALDLAEAKIAKFKDPLNRIESMTIQPLIDRTNTAQIDAGFGRDLGDRITIEETPPGFGSAQSDEYIIQQIGGGIDVGPITSASLTFSVWPA